jgi:hypothetical protein
MAPIRADRVPHTVTTFLLSPANLGGRRGAMLRREGADFPLARALRQGSAPLGDVFAFVSKLYFRGKLAYAKRFGGVVRIIVPGRGLLDPNLRVHTDHLHAFAEVGVDARSEAYRRPLIRDAAALAADIEGPVVLLGSLATRKYVDPLTEVLGDRLHAPRTFVGRGDMSRGSVLLKAVEAGVELEYASISELRKPGVS